MTAETIKFGTDGWRGIIADDFTFANVRVCAQAMANLLRAGGKGDARLVVGYDTRFASEEFAVATAEVLAANGVEVLLSSQPVPTPVTSYGVVHTKSAGAVMITASHNPPQWNGFKVKSANGASADTETIKELESYIQAVLKDGRIDRMPLDEALAAEKVRRVDLESPYLVQMRHLIDPEPLRASGLVVAVDSMYGSGAGYLKKLLWGGRLHLTEIHAEHNPSFPGMKQPEPISHNLKELESMVPRGMYSVGIATDGDADRLGVVDENGQFLTQLQVFALLCYYLLEVRKQRGALVKTTTTTSMVFRLAELYGVPAFETPVGFKYVAPLMMEQDAIIGGEESGGYGFKGHVPERDGILASLYFLDLMVKTEMKPSQLINHLYSKVGPHHYDRLDIDFPPDKRDTMLKRLSAASPAVVLGKGVTRTDRSEGIRFLLSDGSWLFIRPSGTEPVIRIYAESPSPARSAELLQAGRNIAGV